MAPWLTALFICALSITAAAQDRAGRDTPSDWRVKHYVPFGLWDSVCDERPEGDVIRQRCYLRYVEVYSPRPNFLATFVFVYPEDGQSVVEIGFERGTRYADEGFKVMRNGQVVWTLGDTCLRSSPCRLNNGEAQSLLDHFADGDTLVQDFRDRHGKPWRLEWDLSRLGEALQDYQLASTQRALLD
ncbi:MAG: hypothetical protein NXI27_04665 [Alphaproteobacteria bacterium]|nr:hypothetical protein [Alphaproteobacteria bacterium]